MMDNTAAKMTAVSKDNACIVRCHQHGGKQSTETRRQQRQAYSLSPMRTKLLTRTTSLLVVSVLLSANWMLAVEGAASFSSSSIGMSSPSLAPTTTSFVHPSSSPTSTSSPHAHSKKTKKHGKKEKSRSIGVETETGSNNNHHHSRKQHHPKTRKSKHHGSTATTPTAFGLNKGREKRSPNNTAVVVRGSSSTSTSSRSRSGSSKRKTQKSRIRSTATAKSTPTAFVSDTTIRKRKHKSGSNSNNHNNISATIPESRPKKKSKASLSSQRTKSRLTSNSNTERAAPLRVSSSSSSTEAEQQRQQQQQPRGTLTSTSTRKVANNRSSSRTRRSRTKIPSANDNEDGRRLVQNEKSQKRQKQHKHKHRSSKKATVAGGGETVTRRAAERIPDPATLAPEHTEDSAAEDTVGGTKRKRKKKKAVVGEGATRTSSTTTSTSTLDDSSKESPNAEVETTKLTETQPDSKPRKKKRRRKKSSSALESALKIGNPPQVTIDATEVAPEETLTETSDKESSLSVETENNADESSVVSSERLSSEITSTDISAGTEVDADKSTEEITTTGISSPSKDEEKEVEEVNEAVSLEKDMGETRDDLAERKEEESEDTTIADNDVVSVSEQSTVDDATKSIDTVDHEEKGTEITEEQSSHVDVLEVAVVDDDEPIAKENDGMVEDEEENTETVGEEASQVDAENVDDDDSITEENIAGEENQDLIEHEEEKTDVVEEESSEVNTIADAEATEMEEEKATQVDAEVVVGESITEESNIDEESDGVTEIVQEESPKVDSDAIEDKPITEENNDAEIQETTESEDDEDPSTGHKSPDEGDDKENETRGGLSDNHDPDQEISSSEGSDIDPEQDVVSFIEEVLHENVRSWIEESDSHSKNVVHKTRGGAIHVDDSVLEPETLKVDEGTEMTTDAGVSEASEIAEDDCKVVIEDSEGESIEEPKEEIRIIDRESLEKLEDKNSDAVVSVVTWNLAEDSPSEKDAAFIRKFTKNGVSPDQGSDIVLISGQECENIKPRRSEGRRSREYRRLMIKMLGRGYVPLALHLLGGIQFGLFAKRSILKDIEDISVVDVTTGIGNVLHNKGCIAAFVKLKARNEIGSDDNKKRSKSLRMVFVAAHLAAHVKNAEARDADFWRISSELEAQAPEGFLPRKMSNNREPSGSFLFDTVDRVFFCGDLNYRLDLPRELTEHSILHGADDGKASIKDLLRHDQLIHSMAEGRAFPGFGEGKITFMPTFKYDKESSSYDTSHKQRIPAWTDRILFQPAEDIRVVEYQSIPGAQSSDHRPVYGSYRIGMEGRVIPPSLGKRKRKRLNEFTDRNY